MRCGRVDTTTSEEEAWCPVDWCRDVDVMLTSRCSLMLNAPGAECTQSSPELTSPTYPFNATKEQHCTYQTALEIVHEQENNLLSRHVSCNMQRYCFVTYHHRIVANTPHFILGVVCWGRWVIYPSPHLVAFLQLHPSIVEWFGIVFAYAFPYDIERMVLVCEQDIRILWE